MMAELTEEALRINCEEVFERLKKQLLEYFEKSGSEVVVVPMSGGVDSSTVATICAKALGSEKVVGIIMPEEGVTREEDVRDAVELAEKLGIRYFVIPIEGIVRKFLEQVEEIKGDRVSVGNLKARVRMTIAYYVSNSMGGLVIGASNKSELMTGYFTKYGDGGVDLLPLGDLYKTQVKQLARFLGIPEKIVEKTPSAGLWPGQTDEEELGLKYEVLDLVLLGVERGMKEEEIARELGIDVSVVRNVVERIHRTEHKRRPPPILRVR